MPAAADCSPGTGPSPGVKLTNVDGRMLVRRRPEAEITTLPDYLLYIYTTLIGSGVKLVFIGKCVFYKCFVKPDQ